MKAFTVAAVVSGVLVSGLVFAQQPAAPQAAPATAAAKFPEGARYAFVNIQQVAGESAEGKASSAKIEALRAKKAAELNEKNKLVETNQTKLRSSVMSEDARALVQKDIDKTQVEIQRMTQDAQAELQELQNELQIDFQRKLGPVIQAVAKDKGILFLFSQADSGLIWADPGLDLTGEVIRRFDAAYEQPAAKPAAAAPKK
jgi:outer membrane protein